MSGVANPNIPTNTASAAAITARNAEYTGTPFTDVPGDGTYADPYLGMNRAGGSNPGIGIDTGDVDNKLDDWTVLDQAGAARTPQDSGLIGHINAATDPADPNNFTPAQVPITVTEGADINDTVSFIAAVVQAAPGAGMGAGGADPLNRTGATVEIGQRVWGTNTQA